MSKLWGGRFEKETHPWVEEFTASLTIDRRLWQVDVRASIAHARMLGTVNVLKAEESRKIIQGLEALHAALISGKTVLDPSSEDIHSEIERLLTLQIGAVAGKLHTGRSRNDQVATASRLYLREQIDELLGDLQTLRSWLIEASEKHLTTLLPGLTHLQHAQPISLAHHLMAYFWMFQRDAERMIDCRKRVNSLPLGSAALAGTSFALDRQSVARELGFDSVCENSLDAVSDRDYVVEFLSAASLVLTHLSRLAEELILWSTPEFGFVRLDDSVTTGSSIMPQKKNPDVAELIRGKTGRVNGALVGALTLLKGLPLSYNRDLQEDKHHLFEGLDTTRSCLRLMHLMLLSAEFCPEKMRKSLVGDFSNATDVADYLVRQEMPFREAHEVVGRIVLHCLQKKIDLEEMPFEDFKQFSPLFTEVITEIVQPEAVFEARISEGGTSSTSVKKQIQAAKGVLINRGTLKS